jgi:peptide/nickel transport system permease protein
LALFTSTLLVFVAIRLVGDPAALMIDPVNGTADDYAQMQAYLGLDKPILVQYGLFVARAVTGDFGRSYQYHESAIDIVLERLPATLQLGLSALTLSLIVAVPLGILSAVRENSTVDYVISGITLMGQAMPNFWLGILLILLFSVQLRWLPTSGTGTPQHLILPMLALAADPISKFTRLTRSTMLEILSKDFIRTARSKGLWERQVLFYHALKNASIDLITVVGVDLGRLFSGVITIEVVFGWPGMGRLMLQAVQSRDFATIQANVVVLALIVVGANLLADLLYFLADPRIRSAELQTR